MGLRRGDAEAAHQIVSDPDTLLARQAINRIRVVPGNVFAINQFANILVGQARRRIAVSLLPGQHHGQGLMLVCRFQQLQRDWPVRSLVLQLLALPLLAGEAAHVVVETTGRAVVVLQHLEILETAPQQHPVAVHGEVVREVGPPRQVAGDLRTRGDGRNERILPEVPPEQEVGRTMGIAERRGTLAMVQAVAQHVADGREDVIVAFQRKQELFRVEEGAGTVVPVTVVFGDSHLQPLAAEGHLLLLGEGDPVQMRGHDGVRPQLHPAGEALQRQDIGDVSDVLAVPEEDLVVAGDAEMIQSFHGGKVNIFCNFPGVSLGV